MGVWVPGQCEHAWPEVWEEARTRHNRDGDEQGSSSSQPVHPPPSIPSWHSQAAHHFLRVGRLASQLRDRERERERETERPTVIDRKTVINWNVAEILLKSHSLNNEMSKWVGSEMYQYLAVFVSLSPPPTTHTHTHTHSCHCSLVCTGRPIVLR